MIRRPWPGRSVYDAAPINPPTVPAAQPRRADGSNRSAVEQFPTVEDLFRVLLAIQDAKRGDR